MGQQQGTHGAVPASTPQRGTSRTAIWPPAESRGRATRWWLAQKPSHSPGVVRLSPRRLVTWWSRCSTRPCACRKRELGPGAGERWVKHPESSPVGHPEPTPLPAHPKCSAGISGWGCWQSRWKGRCWLRARWPRCLVRPVRMGRSSHWLPMGERGSGMRAAGTPPLQHSVHFSSAPLLTLWSASVWPVSPSV